MVREPNIPLFLWIATAVLVHLTWGGGANEVSEFVRERIDVQRFAETVSERVRRSQQTFEVSLTDEEDIALPLPEPEAERELENPEPSSPPAKKEEVVPDEDELQRSRDEDDPSEVSKKAEAEKPTAEPEKKKEEEKPQIRKLVEAPELPKAPELELPKRIAVEQSYKDKTQADNPNAEFIGEHNNRVSEQSQARITSAEQNDPDPAPGGQYRGPSADPGNAHTTEVAQADDREGNPDHAPGEKTDGKSEYAAADAPKAGRDAELAEESRGKLSGSVDSPTSPAAKLGQRGQRAQQEQEEVVATPDLVAGAAGSFEVSPPREAHVAQQARKAKKRRLPPPRGAPDPVGILGLGAGGVTANGINLNLSHKVALATVGKDQLARQILADGERRRSKHRGSWRGAGLERWRSAIENYVPHVKPGNQTALNTAQVPFGIYLNKIHNRLHPIFAEQFLTHLSELPTDHPLNRLDMSTNVEIVLSRIDGSIVTMGITKASGVTAFDIGALDSVDRAAPFGAPPNAIISPDGNVYLHWEFWRNPDFACSTYFARPKLLRAQPKSAPVPSPSPSPFAPEEDPTAPSQGRQGFLTPTSPSPKAELRRAKMTLAFPPLLAPFAARID